MQLQAHLRHAAHHPQASPGIDPSHLVALIHAASSLGHYHSPLYSTVAAVLLPDLDELPTEELVLATWGYASTLRYASADAATTTPVVLHAGSGPLQQHLAVLRGLSDMLAAAVPQGRPGALLPGELQLLWQAQVLCEQWCRRGSGSDGSRTSGNGGDGMRGSGGGSSNGSVRATPLQLHPRLLEGGESRWCLFWHPGAIPVSTGPLLNLGRLSWFIACAAHIAWPPASTSTTRPEGQSEPAASARQPWRGNGGPLTVPILRPPSCAGLGNSVGRCCSVQPHSLP